MIEPLADFLSGTADVGPDAERVRRLAYAVIAELALRDARLDALDPAVLAAHEIRSLADVERECIEAAVRKMGNALTAAALLGISKDTIYRRLHEYAVSTKGASK